MSWNSLVPARASSVHRSARRIAARHAGNPRHLRCYGTNIWYQPGRSWSGEALSVADFAWKTLMAYFFRLMLLASLSAVLTNTARAQLTPFYTIGADGLSLNDTDFGILVDAANRLLRQPHLAKGTTTSWRNDQSGSHGTISVTNTFHRESMLCHTLSYETIPLATPPGNTTVLNWCKTRDGSWKILSL
jgi:surface antigen